MELANLHHDSVLVYIVMFLVAMGISLFSIPNIIFVAEKKRLLDKPDYRKKHLKVTPNLGGIGIFSAFVFVCCIFSVGSEFRPWCYILGGAFLLFVTGLKDDLVGIDPYKKFTAQVVAALLVVYLADMRLVDFQGLLGIHVLPYLVSFLISLIGITFVTNAINLIDGVDGLAATLSLLVFLFIGAEFALSHDTGLAMMCFTVAGALVGFLRYNIAPARIFMGDTGSLVLGFLVSVVCIAYVKHTSLLTTALSGDHSFSGHSLNHGSIAIALAVIFVPVFDTFRVFTMRIIRGLSPFHPDRTHIHHILLDMGLKSTQVVLTLSCATIFFTAMAVVMSVFNVNPTYTVLLMVLVGVGLLLLAVSARNKHLAKAAILAHGGQPVPHLDTDLLSVSAVPVAGEEMEEEMRRMHSEVF